MKVLTTITLKFQRVMGRKLNLGSSFKRVVFFSSRTFKLICMLKFHYFTCKLSYYTNAPHFWQSYMKAATCYNRYQLLCMKQITIQNVINIAVLFQSASWGYFWRRFSSSSALFLLFLSHEINVQLFNSRKSVTFSPCPSTTVIFQVICQSLFKLH